MVRELKDLLIWGWRNWGSYTYWLADCLWHWQWHWVLLHTCGY